MELLGRVQRRHQDDQSSSAVRFGVVHPGEEGLWGDLTVSFLLFPAPRLWWKNFGNSSPAPAGGSMEIFAAGQQHPGVWNGLSEGIVACEGWWWSLGISTHPEWDGWMSLDPKMG